ncbi:MAG: DUF4143 domain-containing protein [Oscillospiraceae bacterium]|nr:DUF4143 domain-containing protein [Oscillospiraceae bacterium]
MYRVLMEELVAWKELPYKRPLLVQGITQCGKTHLLKEFGAKCYKDVLYFDFEEDRQLAYFFEQDLNPQRIVKDMSLYRGADIKPESTLIIFDGIQYCSNALDSLAYFYHNAPKYHVIAAGTFNDVPLPKIDTLTLLPMNFYEFLHAQNSVLALHLRDSGFKGEHLTTFKAQLEAIFTDFQIIGGMPEVVQTWIDTKSIDAVEKIQARIIQGFENDFAKLAGASLFPKLIAVWSAIPAQLCKENRKFMFSRVKRSWRARDLEDAINLLVRAGLAYKVTHVDKPKFPLNSQINEMHFKLYMCDVGLLRRTARIPASAIMSRSSGYKELKGALVENIVCSELMRIYDSELYYWSADNPGRAEVEFIVQDGDDIIPIVAKAGSVSKTRSLLQYSVMFKPNKSVMVSAVYDKPDVLPVYAFWNLKEWLASLGS